MVGWASLSKVDVVDSLLAKAEGCARTLAKWNTKTVGHIGKEIRAFEIKLKTQRDAICRHDTLWTIKESREKEGVLWWQRARSDYLKYGE